MKRGEYGLFLRTFNTYGANSDRDAAEAQFAYLDSFLKEGETPHIALFSQMEVMGETSKEFNKMASYACLITDKRVLIGYSYKILFIKKVHFEEFPLKDCEMHQIDDTGNSVWVSFYVPGPTLRVFKLNPDAFADEELHKAFVDGITTLLGPLQKDED